MRGAQKSTTGRSARSQAGARATFITLVPGREFLVRGIVAGAITSSLVFGALYWVTAPHDLWPALLAAQLAVWAVFGLLAAAYLRAAILVNGDGLQVHGCFHRVRRIAREDIESVRSIDVFRSVTMDSLPHLYVCGANGRVLLRLRGEFWSRADMERLAAALGMRRTVAPDPLTLAELRTGHPSLVPWWQRDLRQVLRALRPARVARGTATPPQAA